MSFDSPPKPLASVLTPSIPERYLMLEECKRSVQSQIGGPYEHLVHIDGERRGCSWTMNHLAEQSQAEWLLPLADDDLLLPAALLTLLASADMGDVIYAPPLVWGNGSDHFFGEPPKIPSFALIRRTLWQVIGGYEVSARREEDRKFWIRAMAEGARFVRVDSHPTWVYRFHGGNKSYNGGHAT